MTESFLIQFHYLRILSLSAICVRFEMIKNDNGLFEYIHGKMCVRIQ